MIAIRGISCPFVMPFSLQSFWQQVIYMILSKNWHTSYMPSIVQLYFINIDEILSANCKKNIFHIHTTIFFINFLAISQLYWWNIVEINLLAYLRVFLGSPRLKMTSAFEPLIHSIVSFNSLSEFTHRLRAQSRSLSVAIPIFALLYLPQ